MIVVICSRSEAKALSDSVEDDTTYAPDIVISDDIYDISEVVDMKTVDIGDGNFIVSDDENIHIEETTVVNDVNDNNQEPKATTTTEATDELKVFQEVHKLYDLPTDNIPKITTPSPEYLLKQEQLELNEVARNLGEDDIVDVISNFIADKDPMLQLFLSICFIHPSCYQDSPPIKSNDESENDEPLDLSTLSPLSRDLVDNLLNRRTEKARNMLIKELMSVQSQVKVLMFKYIELGVGARGVSVLATKNIIDAVKNIWLSVDSDLEYAKSSIQELFYLVDLSSKDKVMAMAEVAQVIQNVPKKVEVILEEATQDGYKDYVRHSSWDSWKRTPKDVK